MKAIQSTVYAFSGINIFAKATAASMNKASNSAKQANKSLASIHSDISNVSEKDESGTVNPNIDLSKMDNTPNSIIEAIKNGDWTSIGNLIGEKLNNALDNIPWDKIQNKAKSIASGIAGFLNGFITTTDWTQVGNTFAQGLNTTIYFGYNFVTTFDWKQFGNSIGNSIQGFFNNIDWAIAGQTLSEGIKGILESITTTIETIDWQSLATDIEVFVSNIDWSGIVSKIFEGIGAAIGGLSAFIGKLISDAVVGAKDYFTEKINECGGNIVEGIFQGIIDALANFGQWIIDNIFNPFIEGFCNAFGIHSPSTVMAEMGGYLIEGLKNGVLGIWEKIKAPFQEFGEKVSNKFAEIKTNIGNWASNTKETVKEWANTNKTKISECWTNASNTVKDKVSVLKNNISTGLNSAKSTISTWGDNIKTTFSTLGSNATTWGKDLVSNMASGIKNNIDKVTGAVNSVASKIKGLLGFSEPDEGPLSNFHTYMPDMIDLMAQGIRSNMGKVTEELEKLAGTMSYTINTPDISPLSVNTDSISKNTMQPRNIMAETLSDVLSDSEWNNKNSNSPIQLAVYVGNKKLGEILLEDLRNKKRQTGKDIEALVGG